MVTLGWLRELFSLRRKSFIENLTQSENIGERMVSLN
jgi:hypothetical protein